MNNQKKDKPSQPDIDICSDCGEHASFDEEGVSECCGCAPYSTDYEVHRD